MKGRMISEANENRKKARVYGGTSCIVHLKIGGEAPHRRLLRAKAASASCLFENFTTTSTIAKKR